MKNKEQILKIVKIILIILLIIGIFSIYNNYQKEQRIKEFWKKYELASNIPLPTFEVDVDDVMTGNNTLEFTTKISEKEYNDYLKKCKDRGFNIKDYQNENSGEFSKYNKKGDRMHIGKYDDYDVTFKFSKHPNLGELIWPDIDCAKILPKPKSKKGEIVEEDPQSFKVYVGDTSYKDYEKYVAKCRNKYQINRNYIKHKYSYEADDQNEKYGVEIKYLHKGLMKITVGKSSKIIKEETEANNRKWEEEQKRIEQENNNVETTTKTTSSSKVSEIRADVKSTIDSYESFMNDYVEFMKNYKNNGNPVNMLNDYTNFMNKFQELSTKFNNLQENYQLNQKELQYYLDTQLRINEKLKELN